MGSPRGGSMSAFSALLVWVLEQIMTAIGWEGLKNQDQLLPIRTWCAVLRKPHWRTRKYGTTRVSSVGARAAGYRAGVLESLKAGVPCRRPGVPLRPSGLEGKVAVKLSVEVLLVLSFILWFLRRKNGTVICATVAAAGKIPHTPQNGQKDK